MGACVGREGAWCLGVRIFVWIFSFVASVVDLPTAEDDVLWESEQGLWSGSGVFSSGVSVSAIALPSCSIGHGSWTAFMTLSEIWRMWMGLLMM